MNAFDSSIITFMNRFSQKSFFFDRVIVTITGNNLFKGGIIIALLWGLWFSHSARDQEQIRKSILVTFIGTFMGLFVTRILVAILPFRARPIEDPAISFVLPLGVLKDAMVDHAMSFPSDHAALFFGLAFGILLISRRLGFLVLVYVLIGIAMMRIYKGYHYPTDIIVGGLIGVAFVMMANTRFVRKQVVDRIFDLSMEYPRIFYGMFFIVSYQTATLFEDSRKLASGAWKLMETIGGRLG